MKAVRVRLFASWLVLAAVLAPGAAGCSAGDGPQKYAVNGVVTVDGQPLADVAVTFQPASPQARPEGASIRDGRFKLQAVTGSYKVSISAPRPASEKPKPGSLGVVFVESLPASYNTATTLTADVAGGGANEFSYDLRSH